MNSTFPYHLLLVIQLPCTWVSLEWDGLYSYLQVKSKLEILSSYADVVEGMLTHGWIAKIESHGCFVRFYNGVQGFAPRLVPLHISLLPVWTRWWLASVSWYNLVKRPSLFPTSGLGYYTLVSTFFWILNFSLLS